MITCTDLEAITSSIPSIEAKAREEDYEREFDYVRGSCKSVFLLGLDGR